MTTIKYKTLFCDIDGTLFVYRKFETYKTTVPQPIPSVIEKITSLFDTGHCVVLTTARPESLRELTMKELKMYDIPYNQLVMGLARGTRYLINDKEDDSIDRAISINVSRNVGFTVNDLKQFD